MAKNISNLVGSRKTIVGLASTRPRVVAGIDLVLEQLDQEPRQG